MKEKAALNFESEIALVNISRALKAARLARGETQVLAAGRIGVGLSTYQRIESPAMISAVASGTLLTALCLYGYASEVLNLGDLRLDEEGRRLEIRRRLRAPSAGKPVALADAEL